MIVRTGASFYRHLLAVGAGIAVCMLVFLYTGDSDLFLAASSGMGALSAVYLSALLPPRTAWPQLGASLWTFIVAIVFLAAIGYAVLFNIWPFSR